MSITPIDLGLSDLLADPARRDAFFRSITRDEIASQIRDLRKKRTLTQKAMAFLTGMKQSAISRIEQAEYGAWNLATLFEVARALNARWRITLEPAEEAIKEYQQLQDQEPPSAVDSNFGTYDVLPAPAKELRVHQLSYQGLLQ